MVSKLWCAAFCCLWEGNKGEGLCVRRKRLDFPVDQVSTLTANCFIIIFLLSSSEAETSWAIECGALAPHLQSRLALICQFCLSPPPSPRHDWPRSVRPPGNPPPLPRRAHPGVCVQSVSWLPLREPCLHFLSSFPFIKMQKSTLL